MSVQGLQPPTPATNPAAGKAPRRQHNGKIEFQIEVEILSRRDMGHS